MQSVIQLSHVDKIHPLHKTRAQSLKRLLLSPFARKVRTETIAAARDVCLEVPAGQALGVIGANGAGKTTLLRLIAGITQPTRGTVRAEGRILPLLELGAGFHPDLSGYENIFLQGVLFGMEHQKVRELLPAIVEFAELEPFIHMPVRHYSSGMFIRLGFSISVHVDPDVLLIDEAFSVGDLYFQSKSMERMEEFRARGGTYLLVSHDADLIEKACDEVIWIDKGEIVARGNPSSITHEYKKTMFERSYPEPAALIHLSQGAMRRGGRFGTGAVRVEYLEFLDDRGNLSHSFESGEPMVVRATYRVPDPDRLRREADGSAPLDFALLVQSTHGHGAVCLSSEELGPTVRIAPEGGLLTFRIERLDLAPGRYLMSATFYCGEKEDLNAVYDLHARMYTFTVRARADLSEIADLELPCSWELVRG